jgi:hypothetical protein
VTTREVGNHQLTPDAMRAYRAAKALHRDGGSPASAFGLLAAIVEDRTWERLRDNSDRPFTSFTTFIEAPEPGGLGTTRAELVKLLALRHPHEDGAEWRDRAPWLRTTVAGLLAGDVEAGPRRGATGRGRDRSGATVPNNELAARVVAGEVTANAAAREKGWRRPRIVLTSPASVAIRLRQYFTPDQVAELRALLDDP